MTVRGGAFVNKRKQGTDVNEGKEEQRGYDRTYELCIMHIIKKSIIQNQNKYEVIGSIYARSQTNQASFSVLFGWNACTISCSELHQQKV